MGDKRRRKSFSVPPELYFQAPGGFHPTDYNRCLVVSVPCDYCRAPRGKFCVPIRGKSWVSCSHAVRKLVFQDWRRSHKFQYEQLKAQCSSQYRQAYRDFHNNQIPMKEIKSISERVSDLFSK